MSNNNEMCNINSNNGLGQRIKRIITLNQGSFDMLLLKYEINYAHAVRLQIYSQQSKNDDDDNDDYNIIIIYLAES